MSAVRRRILAVARSQEVLQIINRWSTANPGFGVILADPETGLAGPDPRRCLILSSTQNVAACRCPKKTTLLGLMLIIVPSNELGSVVQVLLVHPLVVLVAVAFPFDKVIGLLPSSSAQPFVQ